MYLVGLIHFLVISNINVDDNFLTSNFQLDSGEINSIDSIIKYKETNSKKALEFAFELLKEIPEEFELSLDYVNLNYYIGETFYHLQDYVSSYQYLIKSLELYELLDKNKRRNRNVLKPPWILSVMGAVYFKNGNYNIAESYYNEAIENFQLFDSEFTQEKIFGLSNAEESLAQIEIQRGNFKNAEILFKKAKERRGDDTVSKMYSNLFLMELYILWNKLDFAEEYFSKIKFEYDNKGKDSRVEATLHYSEANLIYGKYFKDILDYNKALNFLLAAKKELEKINGEILSPYQSYQRVDYEIADILIKTNKYQEAEQVLINSNIDENTTRNQKILNFKLLEKIYSNTKENDLLLSVKDSIIAYNENPINIQIQNEFNLLENLILVTDKENELNLSKLRTSTITLISIFSVVSLSLLILFLRENIQLQRQKNYKLKYEKSIIKNELKLKERELFSKINFISQRNQHISNIKDKISKNNNDPSFIKNLENELKYLTSSNRAYKEFDKMLSQVYPKFYEKLNSNPGLSKTDIRLAAYIKMNHSNHEISRISGISIRTVESQRYRLSKKLKLKKGQELNSFINNI